MKKQYKVYCLVMAKNLQNAKDIAVGYWSEQDWKVKKMNKKGGKRKCT